jgi:hypothetical protein
MGSLILLLLVIDRRARVVARVKALQAAAAEVASKAEEQEEWERRRRSLHDQLVQENEEVQAQLTSLRSKNDETDRRLATGKEQIASITQRLEAELARLTQGEKTLESRRAEVAGKAKEAAASQEALSELTADLLRLEKTLTDLKAARLKQQQMYSLVPYKGKRGDNRKPVYIECVYDGLIFHPDLRTMRGFGVTPMDYRAEIARRVAGERAYLLMLVRPDGIGTYYRLAGALQGLGVDYGYEFIDRDWMLDFTGEKSQQWIAASNATPTGPVDPTLGKTRHVVGLSGAKQDSTDPLEPRLQPGRNGTLTVTPQPKPGQFAGTGTSNQPTTGANAPNWTSRSAYGRGKGSGSQQTGSQQTGGPGTSGATGGLTLAGGGNGGATAPGTAPTVPGTSGSDRASTNPLALPGIPGGSGPVMIERPVAMQPDAGPSTAASASTFPIGSGGGVNAGGTGSLLNQNAADKAWPQSANGVSPSVAAASGSPGAGSGGSLGGAGGQGAGSPETVNASSGGQSTGPESQAASVPGSMGPSLGAGLAGQPPVAGGQSAGTTGAPASDGQPAPPSGQPTGSGSGSSSDGTASDGNSSGQAGDSVGLETNVEPRPTAPNPLNSLPGSRPRPVAGSAVRSFMLNRNRDWIITVDCSGSTVGIERTDQRIPISDLTPADGVTNPLLDAIKALVDRRQATVPAGDLPYRPIIRFRVHADGLRAYYAAYPALEPLHVSMRRENVDPDEDRARGR